jgi:hypothetical protein
MAAKLTNGTTIVFGTTEALATNCRITSAKNAVDVTQINAAVTSAIAGRPTVTGSATIFSSHSVGLTLAQQFSEAAPSGVPIDITITSPTTGLVYDGGAVITGFNPSWDNDAVMTAEVTWQYTGTLNVTRPTS